MSEKTIRNCQNWHNTINCLRKPDVEIENFFWERYLSKQSHLKNDYCGVKGWILDGKTICFLIYTQPDNSSISVTNACEYIIKALVTVYGKDYENIRCFESYPEYDRYGKSYFDEIIVNKTNNQPQWRSATDDFLAMLKP